MKIDTSHIDRKDILETFYTTNYNCDIFFRLKLKEDTSVINTPYKKLLYKSYKLVQQNLDEITRKVFRLTFDSQIKNNIIGILFDLPIIVNKIEKWSIGFTCSNKCSILECPTKFVIVVSIHPKYKKLGGEYANIIYIIHELGHIFQYKWFCEHSKTIQKMNIKQQKELRDLTHAIIEWLVDYNFGARYGVDTGHEFLIDYRDKTKDIFSKFKRSKSMNIMDCFDECMKLLENIY